MTPRERSAISPLGEVAIAEDHQVGRERHHDGVEDLGRRIRVRCSSSLKAAPSAVGVGVGVWAWVSAAHTCAVCLTVSLSAAMGQWRPKLPGTCGPILRKALHR